MNGCFACLRADVYVCCVGGTAFGFGRARYDLYPGQLSVGEKSVVYGHSVVNIGPLTTNM